MWTDKVTLIIMVFVTLEKGIVSGIEGNKIDELACSQGHVRDIKLQNEYVELTQWANNLPILKEKDDAIIKTLKNSVEKINDVAFMDDNSLVDFFYRIISFPLQTVCKAGRWIAKGRWYPDCGQRTVSTTFVWTTYTRTPT